MKPSPVLWTDTGDPSGDERTQRSDSLDERTLFVFDPATLRALNALRARTRYSRIRVFRFGSLNVGDSAPPIECFDSDYHRTGETNRSCPYAGGLRRSREALERGEICGGTLGEFSEDERRQIKDAGITSIAFVPLSLYRGLFAVVCFESNRAVGISSLPMLRVCTWIIRGTVLRNAGDAQLEKWISTAADVRDQRRRRRLDYELDYRRRIDDGLLQASRLLSVSGSGDLSETLEIIAKVIRAEFGFVLLTSGERVERATTWHREFGGSDDRLIIPMRLGDFLSAGTQQINRLLEFDGAAFPLVAPDASLMGFIGFELSKESKYLHALDVRAVSILTDLLSGYIQRMRAEEKLAESEERWQSLLMMHPDALVLTRDHSIIFANNSAVDLLGGEGVDVIQGRPFYDFLSAEDFGSFEEMVSGLQFGGVSPSWQHELIRLDGESRTVKSCSMRTTYQGERVMLTIISDKTDEKKAEDNQRRLFETVVEGVLHVGILDPQPSDTFCELQIEHILSSSRIDECNQALLDMFETDLEEIRSKNLTSLFGARTNAILREFIESGYVLKNRQLDIGTRGEKKHVLVNAVGYLHKDKLMSIWISCADITDATNVERRIIDALEDQKEQIGRDLHDDVGQLLTSVRIMSQNLVDRFNEMENLDNELPKRVAHMADLAAQHMRQIYSGLIPVSLYDQDFIHSVEDLVELMNTIDDTTCHLFVKGNVDIVDTDVRLNVYRIVQEAMNNALKHSRAKNIKISIGKKNGHIAVSVEDDGRGIEKNASGDSNIGLGSMEYRARSIGASLSIESPPDGGTLVECRIPAP